MASRAHRYRQRRAHASRTHEIHGRNENNKHAYLPTICEMVALELLKEKNETKESARVR